MEKVMRGVYASMLVLGVASGQAHSAEIPIPTSGMVYNTVDNGWLTYECDPPTQGLLTCSFVQTSIRQQLKPADTQARLTRETADLAASLAKDYGTRPAGIYDSAKWQELCALSGQVTDLANGKLGAGAPPEAVRSMARMSSRQKEDMRLWAAALGRSCASRTLDGLKDAISLSLGQEERTCRIGTNPFKQTFKAQYSQGIFQSWIVADSTPSGDCGLINVSRLVPGANSWEWRYFARKVVTNPTGSQMLLKCSDLDQLEYEYDWKEQSIPLVCDYIKPGI